MTEPILSGLFIYPIKGCRGLSLAHATVDALGLAHDRRFLVVDASGRFLTQRTHPRLATVQPALLNGHLTLAAPAQPPLVVSPLPDPAAPLRSVSIWSSSDLQAEDCGPAATAWFSSFLSTPAHLVRIGPAFHRPVKPARARAGDVVAFADAYPFLLISEGSLARLNDLLLETGEPPVTMDRFRPNLVVRNCPAFAEDTWPVFNLGSLTFRSAGPCARCVVTTTDQLTGERLGPEPLRTLARHRRDPAKPSEVLFGQNLIHETKQGVLRLGDRLAFPT